MKQLLTIYSFCLFIICNVQGQIKEEMYVPIGITYSDNNNIDWKDTFSIDIWVRIMNYSYTNPNQARILQAQNPIEFKKKNSQLLFTRKACDSLVRDYVSRATDRTKPLFQNRFVFGQGAYFIREKSQDTLSYRCVCLPAKMIAELAHGEQPNYRGYTLYLEPKPFVDAFKRFKLDSLDWSYAPYFTLFPVDINPSFDCSKAKTAIEKAICRSAELSELDRQLMIAYRQALSSSGNSVRASQGSWIEEREKACQGKDNEQITVLLIDMYQKRIVALQK